MDKKLDNWISKALDEFMLGEAKNKEATGNIYKYEIRVSVEGTVLLTYVHAENVDRARRLARKLYGKDSLKSPPKRV